MNDFMHKMNISNLISIFLSGMEDIFNKIIKKLSYFQSILLLPISSFLIKVKFVTFSKLLIYKEK